eukprot:5708050-Pyramimonas_sp.AAC.1
MRHEGSVHAGDAYMEDCRDRVFFGLDDQVAGAQGPIVAPQRGRYLPMRPVAFAFVWQWLARAFWT